MTTQQQPRRHHLRQSRGHAPGVTEDRPRDEGTITVFVVVLTAALLAAAGLVVDGGYLLAARQDAGSTAEQAARAGADALARDSLHTGGPLRIDAGAAHAAVAEHLAAAGRTGHAEVTADAVTVTVRVTRATAVLSAVGIDSLTATATATARGLVGIDRPERQLTEPAPAEDTR